MANIEDIKLLDLIPQNLRQDENIKAATEALDLELKAVAKAINETILLARLDVLPERVIDLLAWQWHVDFYESGLPIEKKRELVRQSIVWHRHKGTPYAVQEIVSAVFSGGQVHEWFEYRGEPYHFRVEMITGKTPDSNVYTRLVKAINAVKNTRSWLDGVTFLREIFGTVSFGSTTSLHRTINIYPTKFRIPDINGQQYVCGLQYRHKGVVIGA